MSDGIIVRGIPREEPLVRLYVLALLGVAEQLVAEEERRKQRSRKKGGVRRG